MNNTFDYLIVGGGTAGCVLADHLLRRNAGSIGLLEMGTPPFGRRIHTPSLYTQLFGSRWDDCHRTCPQTFLRKRRIYWPRGRMLGGCTGINAMIYSRGNPSDFDSWPVSWSYSQVSRTFDRLEQVCLDRQIDAGSNAAPELFATSERFLEAAQQVGLGRWPDDSSEARVGFGRFTRTARHGRRQTAFASFLKPHRHNPFLHIITEANVASILLHDERAVGAIGDVAGSSAEWRARKAVVLCAGALHSPRLLMASGIGPKDRLELAGIPVKQDVELVGANLQDHLAYPIIHATQEEFAAQKPWSRANRRHYATQRNGPMASNLAEVGAFLSLSPLPVSSASLPDVQLHFTPNHYLEYSTRERPSPAWSIAVNLSQPRSRGSLWIDPDNPMSLIIDPRYHSDESDVQRLVDAIKLATRIVEQPAWKSMSLGEIVPGPSRSSKERLIASIAAYATTLFHPVGTLALGDYLESPVDTKLKVRGVERLYVADASVIPRIPSANPQAIVMMIASRLSEWIS